MKTHNLVAIVLVLTSCTAIQGIYKKKNPDPQPKCDITSEYEMPSGPGWLIGDSFGTSKARKIARQALKTCPDCTWLIYLGDVYPIGTTSLADYEKKVLAILLELEYPAFYPTIGNHEYLGSAKKYLEFTGKCHQYGIQQRNKLPSASIHAMSIDTNRLSRKTVDYARKWLCDPAKQGIRILFGHHPLWSNSTKARAEEKSATREWLQDLAYSCTDIYLAGHAHHMELIWKSGIMTHVQGGGGRALRAVKKNVEGQLFVARKHGFSVLRKKDLIIYDELGSELYRMRVID